MTEKIRQAAKGDLARHSSRDEIANVNFLYDDIRE